MVSRTFTLALTFLVAACDADGDDEGEDRADERGSTLLDNLDGSNDHLRGVGRLRGGDGSGACTAFLVDNGGGADAPAYVISNGHCTHDWAGIETTTLVHLGGAGNGDAEMAFDFFHDTPETVVGVASVPFATMKGIDLAVVELEATRASLAARGIAPLRWADALPAEGARISVVGAPLLEPEFLRRSDCVDEGARAIMERNWRWPEVRRNRCDDLVEGSSGSPVLDEHGRAFAVINTVTRGAQPDAACWLGAPCELDPGGDAFSPDTNYAMPVTALAACFDDTGRLAIGREGCPLDDGRQVAVARAPFFRDRPGRTWGVELSGADDLTHYREKSGPMGEVRCEDPSGYSAPRAIASQDLKDRPLPDTEGPHVLCLLAGSGAGEEARWQDPAHATPVVIFIDTTAPTRRANLRVVDLPGQGLAVDPIFSPPELSHFEFAFGPAARTDCADPGLTYQPYRRFAFEIPAEILPARLCLRAEDVAGNMGPANAHVLPE
jgi:hypothetical protein